MKKDRELGTLRLEKESLKGDGLIHVYKYLRVQKNEIRLFPLLLTDRVRGKLKQSEKAGGVSRQVEGVPHKEAGKLELVGLRSSF